MDRPPASQTRVRRHTPITNVGAAVGSIAFVAAGYAGLLDSLPLLNPPIAAVVEILGGVALVGSWLCSDRGWQRRTLPRLLALVVLVVAMIAGALWLTGTVTDAYPPSFGVWIGMAFAALAGVVVMSRAGIAEFAEFRVARFGVGRFAVGPFEPSRLARARRIAAAAAVPLTIVGALMLIDNEYGIWPQVGDLLGHNRALGLAALPQALPRAGLPAGAGAVGGAHAGSRNRRDGLPDQGVVAELDAASTSSHFNHRPGMVYLPPAYFGPGKADLPVLIMLVGAPGTPINWFRAGGAKSTADAYAAAHHGIAPILVVVDQNGSATGDTECVDGPQGNAETYLTRDVPAFITATLGVPHDPARWGVVGFSEGGTCALDLVLAHPDIYRHIVDLCGDARPSLGNSQHTLMALFGGSAAAEQAHNPIRMMASQHYAGVTAWFGAGVEDRRALSVEPRMAAAAAKAGIPEHEVTIPGGHNWQFANAAFAQILPHLCTELGCTHTGATPVGSPA